MTRCKRSPSNEHRPVLSSATEATGQSEISVNLGAPNGEILLPAFGNAIDMQLY
jgi:hypothetical protein